ncbi:uncharacterized protein LOC111907759 [Lactuca sativa]|uniref:uncharacterized protein LOC111907759 n=1 Tax=Lactuca sativa TaxID=4236 RepID=UPI000CD8E041|nr:uncharacterized protein LOC111907759 [Lactuca sativa]
MNAVIVQGNIIDDEFRGIEVWSTDSEDEEVRKPTDGRAFVEKEGNSKSGGRYLMVYTKIGVTPKYTTKLTTIVNEDNASACDDHFRSAPIDNTDETIPSKPEKVESKTSSMKNESQAKRPKPKENIHKSLKQLAKQKQKESNLKTKAGSKENSGPCTHCQSCSQTYRKISFGPRSIVGKNRKPDFGPKPHPPHSQPKQNPIKNVKDVKGKWKLVSEDKKQTKKTYANPRKQENKNPQPDLSKPKDNKIKVISDEKFEDEWCFIFTSKEKRNKFDVKADGGIFLGYSLASKAYRVLNRRSKKIEKTYYVTFDDNYVKKLQSSESPMKEIFLQKGQVTVPISNLFEEYIMLFVEPEKATLSEAKAIDNKVDNLKEIINKVAQDMESEPQSSSELQDQSEPTQRCSTFQWEFIYTKAT